MRDCVANAVVPVGWRPLAQRSERAPRIGITWLSAEEAASHRCVRAVAAAGGEPVPLLIDAPSWTAEIEGLDGLVLTGGNAVDPRRYGEENQGLCRLVIPRRDDLEAEALDFCARRGAPVLGVCRGMQFLNVARGGSMLQDLPITTVDHESAEGLSRFHLVEVRPETRLFEIARKAESLRVNSRHHQGLQPRHLAPGLRISAVAPDGVVEGVESTDDWWLVGVQFHPEYPEETPEVAGIFNALIDRAQAA